MLGEFQDGEVQAAGLREFAAAMVSTATPRSTRLLAMGQLSAEFDARQKRARAELDAHHESYLGRTRRRARRATRRSGVVDRRRGERLVKVLASYNLKGGVGKTTAAVNLAYLAARAGHRTLLWDLDPQGAATYLFRVKPRVKGGSAKLVRGRRPIIDAVKATDFERLDLLPADFTYRMMDIDLNERPKPQQDAAPAAQPAEATSTTWSSSTPRRACRWCRRTCCAPPTSCSCRSSRRCCRCGRSISWRPSSRS